MHSTKRASLVVATMLLGQAGFTPAAAAFDVSGTWEGSITCKTYLDGSAVKEKFDGVMLAVSQSGRDVNVHVTNFVPEFFMDGATYDDPKNPATRGRIGLADCANNGRVVASGVEDVWQLKVSTNESNGKGRMSGRKVSAGDLMTDECKLKFTRTDVTDPGTGPCP